MEAGAHERGVPAKAMLRAIRIKSGPLRLRLKAALSRLSARSRRLAGRPVGWSGFPPRDDLEPLAIFDSILVMPPDGTFLHGSLAVGGPVWTEGHKSLAGRFSRGGVALDPVPPARPAVLLLRGSCLWGGQLPLHFGHLVAECAGRIMVLARQRPHDTMLLLAPEGSREWNLHGHVKEVMDWCGLPPDRLCLIDRPMQCDRLRTVPLPEEISDSIPTPGYLALLEENAARLSLRPAAERRVYVARTGMLARAGGVHAGEGYLIDLLQRQGFGILHPESVSLRRQMEVYAGAETLVFAEGSALHGRQLIGWRDQTIAVINRRGGSRMARSALQARSRATLHVDAVQVIAVPTSPEGRAMVETGLCFLDPLRLQAGLATAGIDLSRDWDPSAFDAAVRQDIADWRRVLADRPEFDGPTSIRELMRCSSAVGYGGDQSEGQQGKP